MEIMTLAEVEIAALDPLQDEMTLVEVELAALDPLQGEGGQLRIRELNDCAMRADITKRRPAY